MILPKNQAQINDFNVVSPIVVSSTSNINYKSCRFPECACTETPNTSFKCDAENTEEKGSYNGHQFGNEFLGDEFS